MNTKSICFLSAVRIREMLRAQEMSAVELVEIFIERIEKKNPKINAYCTPTFDLARKMAKEADLREKSGKEVPLLNGIPTSVKDLMATEGVLTTFGNKIFHDYIPDEDAEAVKRLKNAGIVLLGKTNTPNFGYGGGKTENMIFGLTRNPWNLAKTTGGSSGGAAAAVAAGLSPLALASDGGGSIRHPAAICGVYGLKPHKGRVSTYQNTPLKAISGFQTTHYGPITRNVEDAALMLDVLKGPYIFDPYSLPSQPGSYLESLKNPPDKLKIA
ncbi:MAG: amidase, partial [Promethearchaeota archaeon]